MHILVMNCFHWIGYHMVNQLLENGDEVDGIAGEKTALQEHLSMFFGRNSAFNLKTEPDTKYNAAITAGGYEPAADVHAGRLLCINASGHKQLNTTIINTPPLFGEWMPMDEAGMFWNGQYIRFDSDYFRTDAVYIEDFTKSMMQMLQTEELPAFLEVRQKTMENQAVILENTIYLRDNGKKETKLEHVLNHYNRFQHMYE